jgi:GTPase SAR1 family protein
VSWRQEGREPFHSCIQVHKNEKATVEALLTLQALVLAGATWDARCDEMIATGKARKVAPALRVCALTWAQELADGLPLTDIPLEVLRRGAANTQAYIANFKTSREIVFRRKICLVGSSCAGKTSLVKSITSEEPQLVHLDERTIGIDHFPLRFLQPCPQRETKAHEVTFWDFAGQDAYQVAHSLFFSPRTMFLVCVDLEAFTVAFLQASMMALVRKHETQLLDEFIEHTVMRWVRVILARQPDAEFVFIATKEDLLVENEATEQLLKRALMAKLNAVNATVEEMRDKVVKEDWAVDNDTAFVSEGHVAVDTDSSNVVFTSCTSPASVKSARLRIEDLIIKSGRGFQMPDTYTKVLEAIVARRESAHTSDITTRITRVFAPLDTLPAELGIEPELCRTILQTLHDLGDVLWYEDLGVKMFRNTVILDPLLLIDFIRQVINHNHTGLTMPHADLKSLPYWVGLSSKQQMKALKQVLQKFRLVYSADDDRIMDWDSDLIVPAYWQTKTPAAWLFLGDILRIDETTSRRIQDRASVRVDWEHHLLRVDTAMARDGEAVRIHWEFHFEYGLPSSLFDRVIVASVSPHFVFTAGPDWIVHEEKQIAASRIMVGRDGKSLHRTIHVEAVVAVAATKRQVERLWRSFTRLCDAFVDVLCEYPGLAVSSFAWDHDGNKVGLRRLAKSAPSSADSEAWMPPAVLWVWLSELVTKSARRGDQVAGYHRFNSSEDTE